MRQLHTGDCLIYKKNRNTLIRITKITDDRVKVRKINKLKRYTYQGYTSMNFLRKNYFLISTDNMLLALANDKHIELYY